MICIYQNTVIVCNWSVFKFWVAYCFCLENCIHYLCVTIYISDLNALSAICLACLAEVDFNLILIFSFRILIGMFYTLKLNIFVPENMNTYALQFMTSDTLWRLRTYCINQNRNCCEQFSSKPNFIYTYVIIIHNCN